MVVWVNDPDKKTVVIGNHGFVWWHGKRVFCGKFNSPQESPVMAFRAFWSDKAINEPLNGSVRGYDASIVAHSSLMRFVRTGLFPA